MPMTAFIGVRISWLMFARNSVFARLAASAASRAAVSSPSTRFRSPMSLEIDTKPATAPSRRRSDVLTETQKTSPCLVTLRMSPRNPPARVAAVIFSARPGGIHVAEEELPRLPEELVAGPAGAGEDGLVDVGQVPVDVRHQDEVADRPGDVLEEREISVGAVRTARRGVHQESSKTQAGAPSATQAEWRTTMGPGACRRRSASS